MTIRKIAQIGHPILRQRAAEVAPEVIATPAFQTLIDDLVETMSLVETVVFLAKVCSPEQLSHPATLLPPLMPSMLPVPPDDGRSFCRSVLLHWVPPA